MCSQFPTLLLKSKLPKIQPLPPFIPTPAYWISQNFSKVFLLSTYSELYT